jgi:hypothetical protein
LKLPRNRQQVPDGRLIVAHRLALDADKMFRYLFCRSLQTPAADIHRRRRYRIRPSALHQRKGTNISLGRFNAAMAEYILCGLPADAAFVDEPRGERLTLSTNRLTFTYLQYNSAGDPAALQVRFNYIFRTIDNVFISYTDTQFTGWRVLTEIEPVAGAENDVFGTSVIGRQP